MVGQEHVVRTLRNAIRSGRTAHAYLFVGPRGVGKTTLARIFAKALNCAAPEEGNPCGKCASCRAISTESSLDVLEVDAASRNSTGDMRELAEDVLTSPASGRYKIYIIDEVHMLSKAAWNVLLKTVEEPPSHVKFIFATTEVHQVLPTIISRCQRFDLLPIPTRLIAERLRLIADAEKVAISAPAVEAIARAAEGGMRDAQSLLDQMIAFFSGDGEEISGEQVLSLFGLTDRADLLCLLRAMLENRPGEAVKVISSLKGKGKNLETLFDDLLSALRSVELCGLVSDPAELIDDSAENLARYRKLAAGIPAAIPQQLLETLAPAGRLLREALNKQVLLETVILKAMREAHAVKLDEVLRRLNQLRSAGELTFLDRVPPIAENNVRKQESPEAAEIPSPPPTPAADGHREETTTPPPAVQVPETGASAPENIPASGTRPGTVAPETAPTGNPVPEGSAYGPEKEPHPAPPQPPASGTRRNAASSPDGKRRVSIANSDPQAIREAAKNDSRVGRLAELFDGTVIDIHRPTGLQPDR